MLLYYVRHGDPIYHPDSLTELGEKQAKALAKRLTLYGLDKIYCSTSTRAQKTAKPTCDALKKEPVLLDWANEHYTWLEFTLLKDNGDRRWYYGLDDYKVKFNSQEVRALGNLWYKHPYFVNTDCEKGFLRVKKHTNELLEELGFKYDEKTNAYKVLKKNADRVALFAHEGFGKVFLSALLGIPYPYIATGFGFGHSSVTVVYFDENKEVVYPEILQWSNDSHLFSANLLTGYRNSIDI